LFPEIKRPQTIAKNMSGVFYDENFNQITTNEVIQRCSVEESFVIKPTMESGGGTNVKFIVNSGDYDIDSNKIANIIDDYQNNFIIQETIKQHTQLNRINPESINTIRTISFFYKGVVHILSSVLRMGINHARVDNQRVGGISTGINLKGNASFCAYDKLGNSLIQHPQGVLIKDIKIPGYEELIAIIKKAHSRVGHCKLISWDFAVDENASPVLIEINLRGQGINLHQINNGPLFRELTTEVLKEVYRKN